MTADRPLTPAEQRRYSEDLAKLERELAELLAVRQHGGRGDPRPGGYAMTDHGGAASPRTHFPPEGLDAATRLAIALWEEFGGGQIDEDDESPPRRLDVDHEYWPAAAARVLDRARLSAGGATKP